MLSKKSKGLLLAIAIVFSFICVGFAGYQIQEKNRYKQLLFNYYECSLYLSAESTNNIVNSLNQLPLAEDSAKQTEVISEILERANMANENVARLPYDDGDISEVLSYLSYVGNTAEDWLEYCTSGEVLDKEKIKNASEIKINLEELSLDLEKSLSEINTMEKKPWDYFKSDNMFSYANPEKVLGSIVDVNEDYSNDDEKIIGTENDCSVPCLLMEENEIPEEQGIEIAKNFLRNYDINDISFTGITVIGKPYKIPSYGYKVQTEEKTIWVDVTAKGGYPIFMVSQNNFEKQKNKKQKLTAQTAEIVAQKFLESNGFEDMCLDTEENYENNIIANYISVKDGIKLYPDNIKVKINLDDGSIDGFEGSGYIQNHQNRENNDKHLSIDEMLKNFPVGTKNEDLSLAYVITETGETLCFESTINIDGNKQKIFINAINGKQVEVI